MVVCGIVIIWKKGRVMHFEILSEDKSGKDALEILIPKIIDTEIHTYKIIAYKGIGHIPKNLNSSNNIKSKTILNKLPKLLRGYGKTFTADYEAAVILVCDLDNKNFDVFLSELNTTLEACNPKPATIFCIAIEESEAWLLGDTSAIKTAYPNAKKAILNGYIKDSICGTWELLADAIYPGGHSKLSAKGWQTVGFEKSKWAKKICPHMEIDQNSSPSFVHFRDSIRNLSN